MMATGKFEKQKQELLARQSRLMERLERLQNEKVKTNGPLSADFEEQAVEMQNNEVVDALDEMEVNELNLIGRALNAIEEGGYGACVGCGEPISENRLNALPYTELCINCANEQ